MQGIFLHCLVAKLLAEHLNMISSLRDSDKLEGEHFPIGAFALSIQSVSFSVVLCDGY